MTKPLFAGINVMRNDMLPPNTMVVSPDVFEKLKDPEAADRELARVKERFGVLGKLFTEAGWPKYQGSAPASSHQVIDASAPATHPKPANEREYLLQMLEKLASRGWEVVAYNDGGGHMAVDANPNAPQFHHWVADQVQAVDQAWLRFKNPLSITKTVMLVWGNDPHGEELFADYAEGHGFEDAVGKSHAEIFPED